MADFKQRFRVLRKQAGLVQKELADRLGVDRSTITSYETGKRIPDPNGLARVADFFHVSVDYLLGRSDDASDPALAAAQPPKDLPPDIAAEIAALPPEARDLMVYATRKLTPDDWRVAVRIIRNVIDGMSSDKDSH